MFARITRSSLFFSLMLTVSVATLAQSALADGGGDSGASSAAQFQQQQRLQAAMYFSAVFSFMTGATPWPFVDIDDIHLKPKEHSTIFSGTYADGSKHSVMVSTKEVSNSDQPGVTSGNAAPASGPSIPAGFQMKNQSATTVKPVSTQLPANSSGTSTAGVAGGLTRAAARLVGGSTPSVAPVQPHAVTPADQVASPQVASPNDSSSAELRKSALASYDSKVDDAISKNGPFNIQTGPIADSGVNTPPAVTSNLRSLQSASDSGQADSVTKRLLAGNLLKLNSDSGTASSAPADSVATSQPASIENSNAGATEGPRRENAANSSGQASVARQQASTSSTSGRATFEKIDNGNMLVVGHNYLFCGVYAKVVAVTANGEVATDSKRLSALMSEDRKAVEKGGFVLKPLTDQLPNFRGYDCEYKKYFSRDPEHASFHGKDSYYHHGKFKILANGSDPVLAFHLKTNGIIDNKVTRGMVKGVCTAGEDLRVNKVVDPVVHASTRAVDYIKDNGTDIGLKVGQNACEGWNALTVPGARDSFLTNPNHTEQDWNALLEQKREACEIEKESGSSDDKPQIVTGEHRHSCLVDRAIWELNGDPKDAGFKVIDPSLSPAGNGGGTPSAGSGA